ANDAPVWHLAVDGSMARQESARNIAAPVVAVASTAQAIYATDGRALVMLNRDDSDPKYWREVPGLVGQRAIPAVAHSRCASAGESRGKSRQEVLQPGAPGLIPGCNMGR